MQISLNIIDTKLLNLLSIKIKNSFFDRVMPVITHLNDFGQIYLILSLFILLWNDNVTVFINILTSLTIGLILGEGILKRLVKRQRPAQNNYAYNLLIKLPESFSFPSGHTTSSFAVLGIVWSMFPKYKLAVLLIAVLISFSRIYLHVHYPSDVLGGIILGFLCAAITIQISPDMILIKRISEYSYEILKNVYKITYSVLVLLN